MTNSRFQPGDILKFKNGMVGCVTNHRKLALVSPQGWSTPPQHMPKLDDYLERHEVAYYERPTKRDEDVAEAA